MKSLIQTFTRSSISNLDQSPTKDSLRLHEEIDKLAQFKQAIKSFNIPNSFEEDEFNYLKWLRARGYNVEKAKEMLENHLNWRENCIYIHGNLDIPKAVYEQFRWKRVGIDPKGRPIFCLLGGRIDTKFLLETNDYGEDFKRYCHKSLERMQNYSDEQRKVKGYGKMIVILDMTGFTFSRAMSIPLIQVAMYLAGIFEAHYPELLYRAFIINASWYFTTIYNAMKTFLAHETVLKMQVHGYDQSKYLKALQEVIPNDLIPVEFGGSGDSVDEFEDIP